MLKRSDLPNEILDLVRFLETKKIKYYFVGGFTRDYILENKFSKDVDVEVKALPLKWREEIEQIFKCPVEVLPYGIVSFKIGQYQFELQTPRLEYYADKTGKDHHGFEISQDEGLDPIDSFKRRDFTLNAIAFHFDINQEQVSIVDPFEGVKDIARNILETMNPDFHLDPVRFLRALRFKNNFRLKLGPSLEKAMKQFDLSGLTRHYLVKEFFACREKKAFCYDLVAVTKSFGLSLKHLEADITFLNELITHCSHFSCEAEVFASLCEAGIEKDFEEKILRQQLFLQLAKYGKNIILWKSIKEILLNSSSENVQSEELSSLNSWERFSSTEFFSSSSPYFKTDINFLEMFLQFCRKKLSDEDLRILNSLTPKERSLYAWKKRLKDLSY
jgi:hypothetical protein